MKNFSSSSWWDNRVIEAGITSSASDYSEWSHERRLGKILSVITGSGAECGNLHIVDVPCGVGLIDKKFGPFRAYDGLDFSEAACERAKQSRTSDVNIVHGSVLEKTALSKLRTGDWVIACGVLCFGDLFPTEERAISFLRGLLSKSTQGVIANFPWDKEKSPDVKTWGIDSVCAEVVNQNLTAVVHVGYLPHEFILEIKR